MTTPTDPNDPYRPAAGGGSGSGAGTGYDPAPHASAGHPSAGYGTAPGGAPPRNGLGIAALIVGILAVPFGIIFFPIGFVLGLVGIGLGVAGRRRAKRGEATNGGAALTGLVLSVIGLLIAITFGFFFGYILKEAANCTDPELSQAEQQQCLEDELGN